VTMNLAFKNRLKAMNLFQKTKSIVKAVVTEIKIIRFSAQLHYDSSWMQMMRIRQNFVVVLEVIMLKLRK